MAHLPPLEAAVMDAMAWELREGVPDLAAQADASSPGQRRNTGAGLYSQMLVDPNRTVANPDATGLFGTVHVMFDDLADPVGFQVELRQGRLIALHGRSYGQDTRAIDFATTSFEDVFTVNARGESILYRPTWRAPDTVPTPRPAPRPAAPPPVQVHVPPKTQPKPAQAAPPAAAAPTLADMVKAASEPTASPAGKLALVYLGAYALALLFVLFTRVVLHAGWIFGLVVAFWGLRFIHGKKGRAMMADFAAQLDRQGVFQALKPR